MMGSWKGMCSLLKPTKMLMPAKRLTFRLLQHSFTDEETTDGDATENSEGCGRE
jgi:hypothetical protein